MIKTRKVFLYINKITYNDEIYYKFGITNNYDNRFKSYNKNKLKSIKYVCFVCDDGGKIYDIECEIKRNTCIIRPALPKELYEDGFTETISEPDLIHVLTIINKYNIDKL